jgi:hypothetical protein
MDKDIDLNTSSPLRDGTAASQSGGFGASASEIRKGFLSVDGDRDPYWTEETAISAPIDGVKSKSLEDVGGFCGRPQGWQR